MLDHVFLFFCLAAHLLKPNTGTDASPIVYVNNNAISSTAVTRISQTSIVISTPFAAGLSIPVSVSVASQLSSSLNFNYIAPILSSVTYSSAPTSGGIPITLAGSNFGPSPAVRIATSTCSVTSNSDTLIICSSPAGQGLQLTVQVSLTCYRYHGL